jgi:hypothetical protein
VDADPQGQISVLDTVRAGWLMAELRGRLRPGGPAPQGNGFDRGGHVLPLPSERSPTEQAIELRRVLADLAASLRAAMPPSGTPPVPFAERLEDAAKALDHARKQQDGPAAETAWQTVAELIYAWDAAFQDALASRSIDHSRAYELGRALAEMYWALDPNAPGPAGSGASDLNPNCWEFLFGADRVTVVDERLRSLAPHYHPATASAVAATVHAWAAIAASGTLRPSKDTATVEQALRQQLTYWHELLVVDVDPETLLKPYAVLRFTKITPKVLRTFAAEIVLAAVGLGGLVILAILTTKVHGIPGWKTLAAVVGVLGISIGGVQASLKNASQSLIGRLRADLYSDLVTTAISSLPPMRKKEKAAVRRAVRARTVTAALPAK